MKNVLKSIWTGLKAFFTDQEAPCETFKKDVEQWYKEQNRKYFEKVLGNKEKTNENYQSDD